MGQIKNISSYNNKTISGYRGIWFPLGKSEYGYKYSGGFGTYTIKHDPLAIYSKEVNKTFFVYGGTPSMNERRLLCMIGCYDHNTGMVSKPTVVFDKKDVDDPHDNPTLLIDNAGYIWVYVAGRGNGRLGHRYRSVLPYDISSFKLVSSSIMAYPQPIYIKGEGHFLFFTRYDGRRQLFFQTSPDGKTWSKYQKIASIIDDGEKESGHYSTTGSWNKKIAIAFNRHPNGRVDYRTNLYYIQTEDFGKTWSTVDGEKIELPITKRINKSLVLDTEQNGLNLYVKDIEFTPEGNPVILYLTSEGWEAGPTNGIRKWYTCHWDGTKWINRMITTSTHNYDSGSIWIENKVWTVIAPTDAGPQKWGTGGEIVSWESKDQGKTWIRKYTYTKNSPRNHGYVRKPLNANNPFYCMWSDGHADLFSISKLYFGDNKGNVYMLPYIMQNEWEKPIKIGDSEMPSYNKDKVIKSISKNMIPVKLGNLELLVGKYEITQEQWHAIMGSNPSLFQGNSLPVTNINWNEVQEFLKRFNRITNKKYRLMTHQEYMQIAQLGLNIDEQQNAYELNEISWNLENSGNEPHKVGHKKPNSLGIYDINGNVWEWTSSALCPNAQAHKIVGGAWNSTLGTCKADYYSGHSDKFRSYDIGFRIVLENR